MCKSLSLPVHAVYRHACPSAAGCAAKAPTTWPLAGGERTNAQLGVRGQVVLGSYDIKRIRCNHKREQRESNSTARHGTR